MITVLFSAHNEERNAFFWESLRRLEEFRARGFALEIIVGATPGTDETLRKIDALGINFVTVETTKRAERYNRAFAISSSGPNDVILLHHPRSLIDHEGIEALALLTDKAQWGAFTHAFDEDHPLLKFTSWWSNFIRGDLRKIYYLDHCLFIRRKIFERIGGIPEVEIFEDTILCSKLALLGGPLRLPYRSTTSSIRFRERGHYRHALMNQYLKIRFFLKGDFKKMNDEYERGVELNTETAQERNP